MSREDQTREEIEKKQAEAKVLLKELADTADGERQETISLRIGGKLVTLQVAEEQMLPEQEIEQEFREKYQQKLASIKEAINEKVSEIYSAWEGYKESLEEKEKDLQRRLESANIMPEIEEHHAEQGLSVVKASGRNAFKWLYRTVYWPKTIDGVPIKLSYSKRLITPVCIVIKTERDRVVNVKVCRVMDLQKFSHYHSLNGDEDCWGDTWDGHSRKWETPDDIIKIGKEAAAILEEINSRSIGQQEPRNLPKFNTLKEHTDSSTDLSNIKLSKEDLRSGVSQERQQEETRSVAWDISAL